MAKTFSGGIRISKRRITDELQSPEDFSSVTYTLKEGMTPAVSEGQSVSVGAVLCPCDTYTPSVICGISGRVMKVSADEGGSVTVTVTSEVLPEYDVNGNPPTPLDKPLKDCSPEELSRMLLKKGAQPIRIGAKTPKVLTVNCGGSSQNSLGVSLITLYPKQTVGGAKILMKLLGARKCIFAVPDTALSAAQSIEERLTSGSSLIKVSVYKDKYPATPQLIVRATSGVEINASVLPENAGYPVVDPRLCLQVYEALAEGKDVIGDRILITDPDGVSRVCFIPYGARLCEALAVPEGHVAVRSEGIFGSVLDKDMTMNPSVCSVSIVPDKKYPVREDGDCIGCGRCDNVCPAMISPYGIYARLIRGKTKKVRADELLSCFECGCCSAVCPSYLPLSETISQAKALPQTEELSVDVEESFDEAVPEETVGETDTEAETIEVDPVEELTAEADAESDATDEPVDLNEIFKEDGENE